MSQVSNALVPIWYAVSAMQGALIAIGFAVFLLSVLSRRSTIFYLAAFTLLQLAAQTSLFQFDLSIHSELTPDTLNSWMFLSGLSFAIAIIFTDKVLHPKPGIKAKHQWIYAIAAACVVIPLVIPLAKPQIWLMAVVILAVLAAGVALDARRKDKPGALWLGLGWVSVLVGYVGALIIQGNSASSQTALFALALVSCAVAVCAIWFTTVTKSYIDEKKAALMEKQQALAQAKVQDQMQEQLIKAQEDAREELEAKFQERTFELEVTLRELQDTNRELEEKNTQDALTGIRNRRFFDKKYLAEFRRSRREQTELSLMILDIDFFKKVNDNHGHLAGDDVIRFVGRTLADMLKRPSDEACRYGGEEFALILPSTNVQGAIQLGEMLRQRIAQSAVSTDVGQLEVTVSCGIFSSIANLEMNQNQYIELADKALYHAKQTGRNKVVHYNHIETTSQG